jgi:hypothetical protein
MISYQSNTETRSIRLYCPTCVGEKDGSSGTEASSHWLLFNMVPFRQWRESTVKCSGCAATFKSDLSLDDLQSMGSSVADSLKKA